MTSEWISLEIWDCISIIYTIGNSLMSSMNIMLYAAINVPIRDETRFSQKDFRMDNLIQNFICGGISSDTRPEIMFKI